MSKFVPTNGRTMFGTALPSPPSPPSQSEPESITEAARRLGITHQRVVAIRKNESGLCSQCPWPGAVVVRGGKAVVAGRSEKVRWGLCERHAREHKERSRERMRRVGNHKAREGAQHEK